MTIQVTGKNLDVGEALRGYVQERVSQTVEKYIGRGPSGHVRVETEHGEFRTDCTIHLWQGMSLEAHGVAADAYQSADLACERLEKRVRRYKRRVKRHGGHSARKETPQRPTCCKRGRKDRRRAMRTTRSSLPKPRLSYNEMAVSDAVMQMDLSDQPFVLFRNAGSGEINVVYRRDDGNIGWIDPAARQKTRARR
jgi:ribosomal subunit interface protein